MKRITEVNVRNCLLARMDNRVWARAWACVRDSVSDRVWHCMEERVYRRAENRVWYRVEDRVEDRVRVHEVETY
jgi:hypothetical protein